MSVKSTNLTVKKSLLTQVVSSILRYPKNSVITICWWYMMVQTAWNSIVSILNLHVWWLKSYVFPCLQFSFKGPGGLCRASPSIRRWSVSQLDLTIKHMGIQGGVLWHTMTHDDLVRWFQRCCILWNMFRMMMPWLWLLSNLINMI